MGVDTESFTEINVGAFAAAVFVFFWVFECGDVVKVLLDDGSWARGRIEKIYDGDEKRDTTYDIELLDDSYDRRDFVVDLEGFEFPDPPLQLAVGAAVVDLETGRKGRIIELPAGWAKVQFPYIEKPQNRYRKWLRVIPEDQAAPPVVQPTDTALLRGVTATLPDGTGFYSMSIFCHNSTGEDIEDRLCGMFQGPPPALIIELPVQIVPVGQGASSAVGVEPISTGHVIEGRGGELDHEVG